MKSIVFLLPGKEHTPIGGYKIVYQYANMLAEDGYKVTIVYPHVLYNITLKNDISLYSKFKTFIGFYYRLLRKQYHAGEWFKLDPSIKKRFVFMLNNKSLKKYKNNYCIICSSVETAYGLNLAKSIDNKNKFYLIQDFENWNNNTDDYVIKSYFFPLKKIVISKWLQKKVEETNNNAIVIPNGLNFEYFKLSNSIQERSPYEVAMLYHLDDRKRCCDAMAALSIVKKIIPQLHVSMFGVPEKPINIPEWYTYYQTPDQKTHNTIYNNAAIFVAASAKEGWGLPPCEAMQCGAAVVCTDAAGFLEFAINNNTALISPIYDTKKLADNIIELIQNNEKRIKIATNGYNYIQQFTWDKSYLKLKQYLELI